MNAQLFKNFLSCMTKKIRILNKLSHDSRFASSPARGGIPLTKIVVLNLDCVINRKDWRSIKLLTQPNIDHNSLRITTELGKLIFTRYYGKTNAQVVTLITLVFFKLKQIEIRTMINSSALVQCKHVRIVDVCTFVFQTLTTAKKINSC